MAIAPIKNSSGAVAPKLIGDGDDIIDEAIKFFRPNLLFKNFDLKGKKKKKKNQRKLIGFP